MSAVIEQIVERVNALDARVVTVEVANERYDVAIEDIRKMLESDRATFDQRVQAVVVKSFSSKEVQQAFMLSFMKTVFTKKNIATVVGTITTLVTLFQQIGRLL